jgi:hypothetical protein
MARPKGLFEVECPCCQARLKIDPATQAVISHRAPEKPRTVESLEAGLARLKGEAARREELFERSFEAEKRHGEVLQRKFEELLKQARESPETPPPQRDIDLD